MATQIVKSKSTVHHFGESSSPSCTNFGLKQITYDAKKEFGQATTRFICEYFYVDDGLKTTKTEQKVIELIINSKQASFRCSMVRQIGQLSDIESL